MKPGVNPWVIAATVMLATFMEILDTSVANVALPHIAGSLSSSTDEATWVLTSYLVANAIVLPMSGWFSMLVGRKRFYMTCVAIFTLSSLLCGLATSLPMLILFRILQGLGGGALQPISQAILIESFPREKHGMAMAVYGMGVVVAPVIGPTLGGWITDNYSWGWIFFINLPVGILSLMMTSMLVQDPPFLVRRTFKDGLTFDYMGLILLSVGLGSLELVLDEGQRDDWFGSPFIIRAAILAVVCLVSTVFWELRQKDPIIDFRVLKNRNFALATGSMLLLGFVLYGSTTLLPLMLQTLLGYTAMQSGLVLSPGGLAIVICMPFVGMAIKKVEPKWLVTCGVLISSFGLLHMSHFSLDIDVRTATIARIIQSLGLAFLFVPINTVAFGSVDRTKANYASGLINLARNIGGSSGIAMVTTMLARRSQYHQNILVEHVATTSQSYQQMLNGLIQTFISKGADAALALQQAQKSIYGLVQRQASMLAFADTFWMLSMVFLIIVPLMFFMKKMAPHDGPVMME